MTDEEKVRAAIADVDEEIAELLEQRGYYAEWAETCDPSDRSLVTNNRRLRDLYRRILARLEAHRAELARGMKA